MIPPGMAGPGHRDSRRLTLKGAGHGVDRAGWETIAASTPKGHCGCRRRIDRMLATDPKEQARALVYSQVLGSGATSKHPVPARVRRQPRIGSREASERIFSP